MKNRADLPFWGGGGTTNAPKRYLPPGRQSLSVLATLKPRKKQDVHSSKFLPLSAKTKSVKNSQNSTAAAERHVPGYQPVRHMTQAGATVTLKRAPQQARPAHLRDDASVERASTVLEHHPGGQNLLRKLLSRTLHFPPPPPRTAPVSNEENTRMKNTSEGGLGAGRAQRTGLRGQGQAITRRDALPVCRVVCTHVHNQPTYVYVQISAT